MTYQILVGQAMLSATGQCKLPGPSKSQHREVITQGHGHREVLFSGATTCKSSVSLPSG